MGLQGVCKGIKKNKRACRGEQSVGDNFNTWISRKKKNLNQCICAGEKWSDCFSILRGSFLYGYERERGCLLASYSLFILCFPCLRARWRVILVVTEGVRFLEAALLCRSLGHVRMRIIRLVSARLLNTVIIRYQNIR